METFYYIIRNKSFTKTEKTTVDCLVFVFPYDKSRLEVGMENMLKMEENSITLCISHADGWY